MNAVPINERVHFEEAMAIMKFAFLQFHQPLYYFAFGLVKNKIRAEHAVTDSFLECWHQLGKKSSLKEIEERLYKNTAKYCELHPARLNRDRVLAGIFCQPLPVEQFKIRMIEAQVIQRLANSETGV